MGNGNWGAGDSFATGFFSSVGDALQDKIKQQRDNDQKLKDQQAAVYIDAIKSGRLTPEQIAYSQQQLTKIYGGSKPMKELMGKIGNVLHIGHHVSQQQQGGAPGGGQPPAQGGGPTPPPTAMSEQTPIGGSSTQPPGMMPAAMTMPGKPSPPGGATPIPLGTGANPSGAPPTAPMGGPTPPPTFADIAHAAHPEPALKDQTESENLDSMRREMDARKGIAKDLGLKGGSNEYNEYVATGKWPTSKGLNPKLYTDPSDGKNFMGVADPDTGQIANVDTGRIVSGALAATAGGNTPKPIQYQGPNGEALPGNYVGGKYLDRDGKELPEGTVMFHPSLSSTDKTTTTVRLEKDANNNWVEIPVTSTTKQTRGGAGPTPPPKSESTGKSAGPRASSSRSAGTGQARTVMGPDGKPLGAPPPTEVKKAYDAYNAAQERYAVMADALPRAQKGDQQAMVNLLANHIGMTMGLQKGARITQSIYNEAMESSPWLARVKARFDSQGYLTGVVLTPEQMTQMIELAKVRLQQDKAAWQREVGTAKSGYGMSGDTPSGGPTPPPSASAPSGGVHFTPIQ